MEKIASKKVLQPLQIAVIQSGAIAIPFTRLSSTKPSVFFNKLNTVSLPKTSSVARDLRTGYELVKKFTNDVKTVSMVTFVAQKPNLEDIQIIKTLQGLGMKVTIITLGNSVDADQWLGVEGTVPMYDGKNVEEILDQVIEQAKLGSYLLFFYFNINIRIFSSMSPQIEST